MELFGQSGNAGSTGGVRVTPNGSLHQSPDIAIGTGDILHLVFFNPAEEDIEHKTLLADLWHVVSSRGWDNTANGVDVASFRPLATNNAAIDVPATFYFPTVVVDKVSHPDRIYAIYKHATSVPSETISFNSYVYDHAIGADAGWNTATAAAVWSTASSPVFSHRDGEVELDWKITERVSAVVDDRRPDKGEIHIVFTGGHSNVGISEHDIYHGYYNGVSWTLPEKIADDDSDSANEDGIRTSDVFLSAPVIAKRSGDENLYMSFAGGTAEGFGVDNITDVNHHAYFKVIGRSVTSEDKSVPVGGYQYDLTYAPVNPHDATSEIENNAVFVHVADNVTGEGLGAIGRQGDGFLAGDWENVGTSLQDNDKFFEGRFNEDSATGNEWGDDDDKIGLLLKLNVLGSDSSTNLQLVTSSTASDGGTGKGSRTVRVGSSPPVSVAIGDFFLLGADIDIVDANTAPEVSIRDPDINGVEVNTSLVIRYDLVDTDDDIDSGGLTAALYFSVDGGLSSVSDVRVFGTLIVDENDNRSVYESGTNDFNEGKNELYSWGNPSEALKSKMYASLLRVPSGDYYIYIVADDNKNPAVFARSPGAVRIRHKPIVEYIDPPATFTDTVDSGIRSGEKANPYDLDFTIADYDNQGSSQVALFFSSASGLSDVSVSGTYPNQRFRLFDTDSGETAVFIEKSDTLNSADVEYAWDVTDSVFISPDSTIVPEGSYFLYAVVSDSSNVVVGQSAGHLAVKHSPSFTFYEPPKDTHRSINTGSQPTYTIQWQKGPGDRDFDQDAQIDLYFTTDRPGVVNFENFPDSLLRDLDTRKIVTGLSENGEGAGDMYVWDFRNPSEDVPKSGSTVYLYAVVTDANGNETVELGGALKVHHDPSITLLSSFLSNLGSFNVNDVLRVEWDDYLVDDGSGTDDAYIRLYASSAGPYTTINALHGAVNGTSTMLINSKDGLNATAISVREDSADFFDWNTKLFSRVAQVDIYAAISADSTFSDNTGITLDKGTAKLNVQGSLGGNMPHVAINPSDFSVVRGDTITLDVMVQHPNAVNLVQLRIDLDGNSWSVVDQGDPGVVPFIDLDGVFSGIDPLENEVNGNQLRFAKSSFSGEVVGSTTEPVAMVRFQLRVRESLNNPSISFTTGSNGTVLGLVGNSTPLDSGGGLRFGNPDITSANRGRITATVELEGRASPLGNGDYTNRLDVHLRVPGSTIDIDDASYLTYNDDDITTTDTLEVDVNNTGALTLGSVPAGRYVLTVKDSSHVSGRTDTFRIRNGETITIGTGGTDVSGFMGSDLRGDPTVVLANSGKRLIAGDVSKDNEINEDDVNRIITAWGTSKTAPFFALADINNDVIVDATDLTVTTSNFGNSEGFGASPVYKIGTEVPGNNTKSNIDLVPLFDATSRALQQGDVIGFAVEVRSAGDLAGYEFDLSYDHRKLRPLFERFIEGDVFAPNPHGSVFETKNTGEKLFFISSRIGKEWTAQGDGRLAEVWFRILDPDIGTALEMGSGVLLSHTYEREPVMWHSSLAELLLPKQAALEPNFPNPFNPTTTIPFALPTSQNVRLEIYNILGQRIRTLAQGPMDAGFHTVVWNGRDDSGHGAAAGLYFSFLKTSEISRIRKMALVK